MKNHTQESLNEAKLQGQWDREDRKAIQDHYGNDAELNDAYLNGYDPKGEIVPFKDMKTRSDDEIRDELWNDDDSAEQEEDHAQWYRDRAQDFEFHPFTYGCNMCFEREANYIGVTIRGTPFGFCRQCRDELQALKIERTQSPERISV